MPPEFRGIFLEKTARDVAIAVLGIELVEYLESLEVAFVSKKALIKKIPPAKAEGRRFTKRQSRF
jgi:hypothetical protein